MVLHGPNQFAGKNSPQATWSSVAECFHLVRHRRGQGPQQCPDPGEIPTVGGDFLGDLHHRAGQSVAGCLIAGQRRQLGRTPPGRRQHRLRKQFRVPEGRRHTVGAHRVDPVTGVPDQRPTRPVRGAEVAGRQRPDVADRLRARGAEHPWARSRPGRPAPERRPAASAALTSWWMRAGGPPMKTHVRPAFVGIAPAVRPSP